MNYTDSYKNARSKAESFFRSGFAFILLAALTLIIIVSSVRLIQKSYKTEDKAKRGLYLMMEKDMAKCAQIGVKMQYAGAKIEDELLPELEMYLYSLKNMTKAFSASFGEEASPIRTQFLSKVETACARLKGDLSAGYSSKESQEALSMCLKEFSKLLDQWPFE